MYRKEFKCKIVLYFQILSAKQNVPPLYSVLSKTASTKIRVDITTI